MTLSPIEQARAYQRTAADPGRSVFVTANAGSGKTTTLVDRVARLLLQKARPAEILCVTYTKAAAAEMQGRLFRKLGKWAVMDDANLRHDLAGLDGRDPAGLTDADLSDARRLFARALETPGGLKIQTIHAFCEKLLRRFPIEAGVSPAFRVLENEAALALSRGAREDLARAALADADGPVGAAYAHFAVELAGKAFHALLQMLESERGKLTAWIERVEAGLAPDPYSLCGVTPGETPESIERDFLAWLNPAEWRAAAEGFANGSTRDREIAALMQAAVPPDTRLSALYSLFFDSKDRPRSGFGTKKAPPAAAGYLEDVSLKYCAVLDRARAARVADDTVKVLTLARTHAALYEAAKVRHGALDFSDLVERTVDLLTRRSTAEWVLFKLDGGIEHVLVDEAQDTAPDQWAIFKALTGEFFAGEGAPRPGGETPRLPRTIFAVGDEKQSIYSFQGARPERLGQEARAYEALVAGAGRTFQHVPLDTSFRSTEEVLAFVDAAFHGPERTRALVGVASDIPRHQPARAGEHGSVDLWPLFEDPDTPEPVAWNAPVDKEDSSSGRKQLARALAREIRRQVDAGVTVHERGEADGRRSARWGDFLILVRRRDALFEEIIRALKAEAVPVAGADRLKLSSHIVFDDLIAVARFALCPDDDLSLAEVLRSPFCDVTDFGDAHSLWPLADKEARQGRSLWQELQLRAEEQPQWRRARDFAQAALDARDRDPFSFFSSLLNRIDDTGVTGRARILTRLGREAEEAIDETLAQVLAAEDRGGADLETNVALLEAADVEVKREMEGARDEVRVMTVHGAKGLEAPFVILPDTTSRAKPQGPSLMPAAGADGAEGEGWLMCPGSSKADCTASRKAREARAARADAESLRLLYVALTRARDRLIIMGRALKRPAKGYDENSWWDVISGTFQRLGTEGPLAVRPVGDGVLRIGVDPETVAARPTGGVAPLTLPAWRDTPPPPDAGSRLAAPSRMLETLRTPAPSPLATSAGPGAPLGRFRRGDLIHRLLERLPDMAPPERPAAAARMLSRERDIDDTQRAEMTAAAFSVLDDNRFAPVFGPGSRPEVALTGSVGTTPVSGRMDRLVVTPDRVLVIDYKTNRPAPARIEDADPAYVLQMAVYVAVLRDLYPDRAVEAALVWTDGPRLMAVPEAMMDAVLSIGPDRALI